MKHLVIELPDGEPQAVANVVKYVGLVMEDGTTSGVIGSTGLHWSIEEVDE